MVSYKALNTHAESPSIIKYHCNMPHLSVLALKRCHLYSHHVFKVGGGGGFGLVMACRALPQIFNIVWVVSTGSSLSRIFNPMKRMVRCISGGYSDAHSFIWAMVLMP